MRRRFLIGMMSVLCLICSLLCGARWGYPALLTLFYGQELEQALQHHWDVCRSPETFENPLRLSEVATGDFLTSTMGLYATFDEPPTYLSSCQVTLNSVKEYTPTCSRISAQVICGEGWSSHSGEYIFLREESQWKVVNLWQWLDTHNTLWSSSHRPMCTDFIDP